MRWSTFAALALALLVAFVGLVASADATPRFQVIVNPSNPAAELDRSFVEDAFLKKVSHWPNDEAIKPADLPASSPVRRAFSDSVLRRSVDAVKGYWQQRIFSGRDIPPPELDNDDEVIRYVLKYPGAMGYVSGSTPLGGTKAVTVR